jgi:uncharacterized membrane protein
MATLPVSDLSRFPENKPFVAPCRTLGMSAPCTGCAWGGSDMVRAPRLSLAYGVVLMALSLLIAAMALRYGTIALYIGLATGFVFIGPVLAVGLYAISRQLGKGQAPGDGLFIVCEKAGITFANCW